MKYPNHVPRNARPLWDDAYYRQCLRESPAEYARRITNEVLRAHGFPALPGTRVHIPVGHGL